LRCENENIVISLLRRIDGVIRRLTGHIAQWWASPICCDVARVGSFIKWNNPIQSPGIKFSSPSFPVQYSSYVAAIQDKQTILG